MIKSINKWLKRIFILFVVGNICLNLLIKLEEYYFYNDISHYKWAKHFQKNNFNFWEYPWSGENIKIISEKGHLTYSSPKEINTFYYYYPDKKNRPYTEYTAIYNQNENKGWILDTTVSHYEVKWVFNESYMIYVDYEDRLFKEVEEIVNICNLKIGKCIILTKSNAT